MPLMISAPKILLPLFMNIENFMYGTWFIMIPKKLLPLQNKSNAWNHYVRNFYGKYERGEL